MQTKNNRFYVRLEIRMKVNKFLSLNALQFKKAMIIFWYYEICFPGSRMNLRMSGRSVPVCSTGIQGGKTS